MSRIDDINKRKQELEDMAQLRCEWKHPSDFNTEDIEWYFKEAYEYSALNEELQCIQGDEL